MRKIILLLFAFPILVSAADGPVVSCSNKKECGEMAGGLGFVAVGIGALIGPHYFLKQSESGGEDGHVSFGLAENNYKELYINLKSYISEDHHWLIDTNFHMQIYDKTIPSTFKYAVGVDRRFELDTNKYISQTAKISLRHIEDVDGIKAGVEAETRFIYYPKDSIRWLTGIRLNQYEQLVGRAYVGTSLIMNRKYKTSAFILLEYEEDSFLKTKKNIFSIGMNFF